MTQCEHVYVPVKLCTSKLLSCTMHLEFHSLPYAGSAGVLPLLHTALEKSRMSAGAATNVLHRLLQNADIEHTVSCC